MRVFFPVLAVLASLAACGGGGSEDEAVTLVYKTMGSRQCTGGGVSLATLQAQLAAANVQTLSAECGNDGMAAAAVCGASDGRIGIFQISSTQAGAAAGAGFAPLATLPAAKVIPCT